MCLNFLFKKKFLQHKPNFRHERGEAREKKFAGLDFLLLCFFLGKKARKGKNNTAFWGKLPTSDVLIRQHRLHARPPAFGSRKEFPKYLPKIFTETA